MLLKGTNYVYEPTHSLDPLRVCGCFESDGDLRL
jgi:hypothetical protein